MEWQFLVTGPDNAENNMQIDRELFLRFLGGKSPPTIRFYWFSPPAITIGRLQDENDIKRKDIAIVKRPTGGRAVFHKDDLVYSMIMSKNNRFFGGSTLQTYKKISALFLITLRKLGLNVELVKMGVRGNRGEKFCFSSTSRYELIYNDKKILGSAQRRERDAILQQGSLLVPVEREKIIDGIKRGMQEMGIILEKNSQL